MKKLYFISKDVSRFLSADQSRHQLKIVSMGVPLFERNSSKHSNTECIFRISQTGVKNVVPYMTKRIIWLSNLSQFKQILMEKSIIVESLKDENFQKEVDSLAIGCFVVAIKVGEKEGEFEAITMHKFAKTINFMVKQELLFSFYMRYLTAEERAIVSS